jgi:hypothetical protein
MKSFSYLAVALFAVACAYFSVPASASVACVSIKANSEAAALCAQEDSEAGCDMDPTGCRWTGAHEPGECLARDPNDSNAGRECIQLSKSNCKKTSFCEWVNYR